MSTINPRITFALSEELRKRIDEYRFNNRIGSQSKAIVRLVEIGLEKANGGIEERPVPEFVDKYFYLDKYGKHLVQMVIEIEEERCKSSQRNDKEDHLS